jgi:hypothetical protein
VSTGGRTTASIAMHKGKTIRKINVPTKISSHSNNDYHFIIESLP